MKKVLYVTTVSRTINAFLVPHINMLLNDGYYVDCACSIDKELDKSLINKGVKIFDIPFNRNPLSIANIKAFKELIKIQKENKYDIVHVHTPVASIFGRLLKLRFNNLKTIYTAHGYHFLKGGSKLGWMIYYPIEKFMAKFTDVTININSEDYEITKNKLKPNETYYLKGVGIDLTKYKLLDENQKAKKRLELGLKDHDFIVIMIAELNENKNQIQLIKALEILKNKYKNIKALCVGEGDKLNELTKEVKIRALENNISFLGFRTDINELINISDIGVLLSYREGLPRNIMELMANGKKVIATDIRGNRDLVCNSNVGTLVKVGDYEETAKAIEMYIKEKKSLEEVYNVTLNKEERVIQEIKDYEISKICEELRTIYISLGGID
ncbi:glycosyltransferase family 4 protein [Clostridium sp.]|uniref:glycosyltransferase family 4 protein n=1 Tax=Clostridium sp. TaxID=1506 RepID=UPI002A9172C6|nr:glycosyltransferase family 4 protein [Clostridium sp.]MDY6011306.1 glycosyltransferase family 4 protein [Clostridium sp.]